MSIVNLDPCTIQSNSDQYEHLKKELDKLRFENERLQRRKDELELFVEQIKLKEGYGMVGSSERELKVNFGGKRYFHMEHT